MAAADSAYCSILVAPSATAPQTSEIIAALESNDVPAKVRALKQTIQQLLAGEPMTRVLVTTIRYCITTEDHELKKLLMLFWEVVPKYEADGKLRAEMILVCNALRNDLNHPNEYIRGCMLRFLCKLKEPELLEPLMPSIVANLEHRHSYVRRNAVLTVFHVFKNSNGTLMTEAPALVEQMIEQETDMNTRRNAFLMLYATDQTAAMNFLARNMDKVSRFGDGFQLVILELTRKVCRRDPSQKSRLAPVLLSLLDSQSPAVSYEAAWTLVTLSSAPTAVRAAASTYTKLLSSQSDNNVKLIVLERLETLKANHPKVVQELLLDVMRALASPNQDIQKKTLGIAMDLVTPRNVDEVMAVLRRELLKTQDRSLDNAAGYRSMLIQAVHKCAIKFPEVAAGVVGPLLGFLGGEGAQDVIEFVCTMVESYPALRESLLTQLMDVFPDIQAGAVQRAALWILGDYCDTEALLRAAFGVVRASVGELPITEEAKAADEPAAGEAEDAAGPTTVTRNVVLADGTYATQTVVSEEAAAAAEPEPELRVRKNLLAGDYFLGSVLAVCITKLCLRAAQLRGGEATGVKKMMADTILVLCSIVQAGLAPGCKHPIDAGSRERVRSCLRMLVQPAETAALVPLWLEEGRAAFSALLAHRREAEAAAVKPAAPAAQPDDLISFRQLRDRSQLGVDIDLDDGTDLSRAAGDGESNEFANKLNHVHQLTGFADPVYAEAYVTVHDYDIVLDILVINRTPATLTEFTLELAAMGDLRLVERPQTYTLAGYDQIQIRATVKVASTETGHIFGTIVYGSSSSADKTVINLNSISLDIMDYIAPADCTPHDFRAMWAQFEWENKIVVVTAIPDVVAFVEHIVAATNMRCLTPTTAFGGSCDFLAANLYARSVFGEDALVNVSVEKNDAGKVIGNIRIRSKTQGIALSLGDRISAVQRDFLEPPAAAAAAGAGGEGGEGAAAAAAAAAAAE